MPDHQAEISVIIPLRDDETEHHNLLKFFKTLNDSDFEIITTSGNSRANALNNGIKKSVGKFLWFVHADTKIESVHIDKLKAALQDSPDRIHYFDLKFDMAAGAFIRLNSWGANLRSRLLGFPWGDQGLCLSREILDKIGQYDENLPYGEDHALILKSRMMGIKLSRIAQPLITSSRLYKQRGWIHLTLYRQIIWPILTIKLWRKYRRELHKK